MNVLIAGPCAVGKSTLAKSLSTQTGKKYLDFDELGLVDMATRKGGILPFSKSGLNFKLSLLPIIEKISGEFILDIGGDTVFYSRANNNERLTQVLWLKKNYTISVFMLVASREILFKRFATSKNRKVSEFDDPWQDWITVGEPYWRQCSDIVIDTSLQAPEEICQQVKDFMAK